MFVNGGENNAAEIENKIGINNNIIKKREQRSENICHIRQVRIISSFLLVTISESHDKNCEQAISETVEPQAIDAQRKIVNVVTNFV